MDFTNSMHNPARTWKGFGNKGHVALCLFISCMLVFMLQLERKVVAKTGGSLLLRIPKLSLSSHALELFLGRRGAIIT